MKRLQTPNQKAKIEFKNPHWEGAPRNHWQFYCPFCGVSRRLKMHPKPQPKHFFQVGLTSAFLTVLTWPLFGIKGLVVFIPLWIGFEVLYRLKVRAELSCGNCGFDPVLYLADLPSARKEMEAFWSKKKPQPKVSSEAPTAASEVSSTTQ